MYWHQILLHYYLLMSRGFALWRIPLSCLILVIYIFSLFLTHLERSDQFYWSFQRTIICFIDFLYCFLFYFCSYNFISSVSLSLICSYLISWVGSLGIGLRPIFFNMKFYAVSFFISTVWTVSQRLWYVFMQINISEDFPHVFYEFLAYVHFIKRKCFVWFQFF